jgi:hypothetical protein
VPARRRGALQALRVAAHEREARALRGQQARDGLPDAAPGAGDQRVPFAQPAQVDLISRPPSGRTGSSRRRHFS